MLFFDSFRSLSLAASALHALLSVVVTSLQFCSHAAVLSALSLILVLAPVSNLQAEAVADPQSAVQLQPVSDIRIEGLQRVPAGSVFAALPVQIGDQLSQRQVAAAARSVFATGNFQDIQIGIDGGVMVITLLERPSISEINIEGNKAIETEALLDGLLEQGMAEGRVFQRATLDAMRRELTRQYGAQGRYDAKIETDVTAKPRNRVAIDIVVDEGSVATIKQISVVGNSVFDDETIKDLMQLKDKDWLSFFNGSKKYAREKLSGDLETINDFYLDRGYIQYKLRSVQVAVSPKKDSVYVTLNVDEGEQYTIANIELAGDVKEQSPALQLSYQLRKGQYFSQARVTQTEQLMQRVMGNLGYAFAEVKSIPEIDDEKKTVDLTFFVDPGARTYVRRIEFSGNSKTQDEVLRREMRQMEGGLASTELIEYSKVRLERLGFFKEVKVETPAVAGTDDLVDVRYAVEEQSSGSISASVGYSQDVGLIFGGDFQQKNFMGTGKQVTIQANRSRYRTSYGISYVNPYYTEDGVSRGFSLYSRETNFDEVNISSFSSNTFGASVIFGYPLTETQRLSFSAGYAQTEIETGAFVVQEISATPKLSPSITRFIDENADLDAEAFLTATGSTALIYDTDLVGFTTELTPAEPGFLDLYGDKFDNYIFTTSWRESTLNRGILATRGHSNTLQLEVSVPGSDLEFYKLTYSTQYLFPITNSLVLRLKGELGYGDGYNGLDRLPFFEHFFAGGFGSVRGFESNTLGPQSTPAEVVVPGLSTNVIDIDIDSSDNDPMNTPTDLSDDVRMLVAEGTGVVVYEVSDGGLVTFTGDEPDPFGGNILVSGSVELLFPLPFIEDQRSVRTALFVDYGNVFSDNCGDLQLNCSTLDLDELRYSAGVGLTWLSGFGPLSFSLGFPLNETAEDQVEHFQFSLGRTF